MDSYQEPDTVPEPLRASSVESARGPQTPRLIPQVILKSNIYGIRKRLIFERLSMGRCNFGGYSVPHVSERYNR